MKRSLLTTLCLAVLCAIPAAGQNPVKMTIRNHSVPVGGVVNVGVELFSTAIEATDRVKYSVTFDQTRLTFLSANLGPGFEIWTDSPGVSFVVDTSKVHLGAVGISIQLPANWYGLSPTRLHHITNLRFLANAITPSTPARFGDFPTTRLTSHYVQGAQGTDYIDGQVEILAPGQARKVRIPDALYDNLLPAIVPIEFEAQGNENAIGFSVFFDITRMGYRAVSLGPDAAGAQLSVNTSQYSPIGIALALPPGQTFTPGLKKIVNLHFQIFSRDGPTTFYFSDTPIQRELISVTATPLPLHFESPTITFQQGYEGDAAPRTFGNRAVTLADWVQIGRFAASLDTPDVLYGEFQRADCAPSSTGGDGRITLADWVQAGRYAAALDPLQHTSGPGFEMFEASQAEQLAAKGFLRAGRLPESARRVLLSPIPSRSVGELLYSITLHGRGDENALAFTLEFDADGLELLDTRPADERAAIHLNRMDSGRVGFVLALPPGQSFGAGESQVLVLRFLNLRRRTIPQAVQFADSQVRGEVVTVEAESVPAVFGTEAAQVIRRR